MRKAASRRLNEDKDPEDSRLPKASRIRRDTAVSTGPHNTDAVARMQLEVAAYIEEIGIELSAMARAAQLSSLAYFVDMMRLEAAINRRTCQIQLGEAPDPNRTA